MSNLDYITPDYITSQFPDYTFGASGTDFTGTSEIGTIIQRAGRKIDRKLQGVYGTVIPLFGTNEWGTLATVPQVIKDICCDLTMGIFMENRSLSITPLQHDWGTMIYHRARIELSSLARGEYLALPFSGTVLSGNTVPSVSGNYVQVYGESITMDGTKFVKLDNITIIKGDISVYVGTDTGTTEYIQGTDYEIKYFGDNLVGTMFGHIRRLDSSNIGASETVLIDYRYKPTQIFNNNDYLLWGEQTEEVRK